jgi:DNA-binding CsgD family transcriptional regulator
MSGGDLDRPRAEAWYGAAMLALLHGDAAAARTAGEASLALWLRLGDRRGIAFALNAVGVVNHLDGKLSVWAPLLESVAIFRELDDAWGLAYALIVLGNLAIQQGDIGRGDPALDEGLSLFERLGDEWGKAFALRSFGRRCYQQGEYEQAAIHLEISLDIFRNTRDRWNRAGVMCLLAQVKVRLGETRRAEELFEESLAISRSTAQPFNTAVVLRNLGELARERGDFQRARELYRQSLEVSRTSGHRQNIALAMFQLEALSRGKLDARPANRHAGVLSVQSGAERQPAGRSPAPITPVRLTRRETSVLQLLVTGKSNPEIAEDLTIGTSTVATHITNIFTKIGVNNRVEAALFASRHGIGPASY